MCIYSGNSTCYLAHGDSNDAHFVLNLKGPLDLLRERKEIHTHT